MSKRIIYHEGNFYPYSSRLFRFIDINNKEYFINYELLIKKSSTIKKMTTLDFSQQKDIMTMKIEQSSDVLTALIEYIEHNKISNTKIDWSIFLNVCSYLSLDTEHLSKTLDVHKKLLSYNQNKLIINISTKRRIKDLIDYIHECSEDESRVYFQDTIKFLEAMTQDNLFPYYDKDVYDYLDVLVEFIVEDIDKLNTIILISSKGKEFPVNRDKFNAYSKLRVGKDSIKVNARDNIVKSIIKYVNTGKIETTQTNIESFIKVFKELEMNIDDLIKCVDLSKKLLKINKDEVKYRIDKALLSLKGSKNEDDILMTNFLIYIKSYETFLPYYYKDTYKILNQLYESVINPLIEL